MAIYNVSAPDQTYTIQQFIDMREIDSMTYHNYSILERSVTNSELVYSVDNVIYTYLDDLKRFAKIVTCTTEEKIKYAYKPKLLAFDLYGSTELYFVLLALNGKCNFKEFDLDEEYFYALHPSDMVTFMNRIYNAESEHIRLNRNNEEIYES